MSSKKAFDDASYSSIAVFYPDQLRIIGGLTLADPHERGPLDTDADDKHPLFSRHRLAKPLKASMVESIDLLGVLTPIEIVKLDGTPTVNYGRSRTRGARIVNHLRKERCKQVGKTDAQAAEACAAGGFALIKIKCDVKQGTEDMELLGRMVVENHHREDDDLATTIEIAAKCLDRTNDAAVVARMFGVEEQTLRAWMRYDQTATRETREAVKAGRINHTSAAILAQEADPEKQNALLITLLGSAKPTVRKASQIVRESRRPDAAGESPFKGRRQLTKFKDFISEEKKTREDDAFVEGVLALLNLQTTGKANDKRLSELFKKFEG